MPANVVSATTSFSGLFERDRCSSGTFAWATIDFVTGRKVAFPPV